MSRRTARIYEPGTKESGHWMVTLSDLMTLLLTFFILVLAFSALRTDKATAAAASAVSALGAKQMGGNAAERVFRPIVRPYVDPDIERQKSRQHPLRPEGVLRDRQAAVTASLAAVAGALIAGTPGGFEVRLPAAALFDGENLRTGSAAGRALDRIAAVSRRGAARISILSGGDSAGAAGAAAWRERLILRSDAVARYLNETGGIPAERIAVAWSGNAGADDGLRLGVAFED